MRDGTIQEAEIEIGDADFVVVLEQPFLSMQGFTIYKCSVSAIEVLYPAFSVFLDRKHRMLAGYKHVGQANSIGRIKANAESSRAVLPHNVDCPTRMFAVQAFKPMKHGL